MVASALAYWLLALAAVLFAAAAWAPPLQTAAVVLDLGVLILFIADYLYTAKPKVLRATRLTSDRLSIGQQNDVELHVYNEGGPTLRCKLRDDYPIAIKSDVREFAFSVAENGVSRLKYNLLPRRRGAYEFGKINLRYLSALRLFWRDVKIASSQSVKVYSDLKALHDLSVKLSKSAELGELNQKKRGQGTDFSSLREYTVGDDAKAIDWKATARRDRPVVRTYEVEQEQRMLILIDAGRMMVSDLEGLSRFDHALNAALCLALTGLTRNDQVGFGIFADKPLLYLAPRRGKSHMKNILEKSFAVEPKLVEPDYSAMLSYFAAAQKGRALIVVLTDLTDPMGSQALLAGLASLSGRHLPFCVTLKDRQVLALANSTVEFENKKAVLEVDMDAAFKRAVAIDLLAQRELSLSVLQRRGCLILDCPPQDLSTRLVDTYLEIKKRARL